MINALRKTVFFGVVCVLSLTTLARTISAQTYAVTITFQGPWAFYEDGKNHLIAIAPDVPGHPSAFVRAQNVGKDLDFGVYSISLPTASVGAPSTPADIATVSTTATLIGQLLQVPSSTKRYAVQLPMPDDIFENLVDRAKVDVQYEPTTSEQDYTTEIWLSYTLTSLTGVSLTGTTNAGATLTPLDLPIPNRAIHIGVASEFINDPCDNHAKKAFKDLTSLFGQPWYVEYPPYDSNCPKPLDTKAMSRVQSTQSPSMRAKTKPSPEMLESLQAMKAYFKESVKADIIRYRLSSEVAVVLEFLGRTSDRRPSESATRRALSAAMDLRGYLISLPNENEKKRKFIDGLGPIIVHIFNTGGKNCKAPSVWVIAT